MIVYKDLTTIESLPATCVALGYFDGIHAGHQALIGRCVRDAKARGVASCVFTFSNSPKVVLAELFGGKDASAALPQALMTWDEKVAALDALGVDILVAPPFDRTIMNMEPEAFVRELLLEKCHMAGAYCGFNYTFGRKAAGKAKDLAHMGREGVAVAGDGSVRTYSTYIQPPYRIDGRIVSSTLVRELITRGEIETANRFLGHAFSLEGDTVPGRRIGTSIGFPTANFVPDPILVLPPDGVYATEAEIDGVRYPGVTNIGRNPTVSGADESGKAGGTVVERRVETHLFDPPCAEGEDLYGRHIRVRFYRFLRGEVKFDGETALKEQIARDKEAAREFWKE